MAISDPAAGWPSLPSSRPRAPARARSCGSRPATRWPRRAGRASRSGRRPSRSRAAREEKRHASPEYRPASPRLALDDRDRQARDADHSLAVVADFYVPHLRAPAEMDRARAPGHVAVRRRPQVIRVDLHAHDLESLAVDAHSAADAAERLRQRHRSATVQDAIGLHRASVHRHPRLEVVRADVGDLDAEMLAHRVALEFTELFDRELADPDTHGCPSCFWVSVPAAWPINMPFPPLPARPLRSRAPACASRCGAFSASAATTPSTRARWARPTCARRLSSSRNPPTPSSRAVRWCRFRRARRTCTTKSSWSLRWARNAKCSATRWATT